jgi:hypothetical protein
MTLDATATAQQQWYWKLAPVVHRLARTGRKVSQLRPFFQPATPELDRYVVDTLMRDLVGHDRCPSAFVVYLAIHAAADEGRALFSYAAMAEATGMSKRTCQNAVAHLRRRQLVEVRRKGGTDAAEYRPLRPWGHTASV